MTIDKERMKTSTGNLITEALFLENGYREHAIYTLKDEDFEYEGRVLPSIKKIYMEECFGGEDGEYDFACKNFVSWAHWKRIVKNKKMTRLVQEWRDEIEVKIRSNGLKRVIENADNGSFQAAKWVAEGGFNKRKAGRPSKEEIESSIAKEKRLEDEYADDIVRLNAHL
jgi:hypothetical protein